MPKSPASFRLHEPSAEDAPAVLARAEETRPPAHKRGYNKRWEKARATFLARHPLCAECRRNGRVTAANVVDHVVPHRGDSKLFWDTSNWQPLCTRCHNRKTRRGE